MGVDDDPGVAVLFDPTEERESKGGWLVYSEQASSRKE